MIAITTMDQYDSYGKKQTRFFTKIKQTYGKTVAEKTGAQVYEVMRLTLIRPLGTGEKQETIYEQRSYISHNTIHVAVNLLFHHYGRKNPFIEGGKEQRQKNEEELHREEMSDYDRYVQTSWLKEIYKTYRSFVELAALKEPEKGSIHYPIVTLFMKKNTKPQQVENRQGKSETTYSESDTRLHIEKNMQMIENGGYGREAEAQVVYANIDMNHIVNQVYRDIEEKLRYERLKKGL